MSNLQPDSQRARLDEGGPWARWGWLMAVVWLVFLYFPGLALTQSPAGELWVLLGWVAVVAFAIFYVSGFILGMRAGWRQPPAVVLWCYAAAALSAGATVPAIGWEATSFLPFLMAYAAYGISFLWHWIATAVSLVLITAHVIITTAAGEEPPWILVGIISLMAAVNSINVWLIDRSVTADQLRMDLATSEERESIARDVHDLLGHSMTVVKLKAELASRLIDVDPARARAELEDIVRLTGEAIAGVRGTVTGLRSGSLHEQLALSRSALESAGLTFEVLGETHTLSPAQAIPAGWILRESTTNILRHAHASRVRVTLEPGTIVIEDDGVGVQGRAGNGLRGMAERAAASGATLNISDARHTTRSDHQPREVVTDPLAHRGTRVSVIW